MARTASRTTPNLGSQPLRGADFEFAHSSVVLSEDVRDRRRGFTIVELLIVVVVIAILAAITIVAYNGITNRSKAAAASAAAEQAAKKVLTYAAVNSDQYPTSLSDAGVSDGSVTYQYRVDNSANPKTFCVTATTQNVSYWLSSASATPAAGACAGHGMNGGGTVTNYATNPRFIGVAGLTPFLNIGSLQTVSDGGVSYAQGQATSAALAGLYLFQPSERWNVYPGQSVFARVLVRNPNASSRSFSIAIRFFDSSGTALGNQTGATGSGGTTIVAGGTTSLAVSSIAPANTLSVGVSVSRDTTVTPTTGDVIQATNVWLSDRDAAFATGDSQGWVWNGSANSSTSTGPAL